MATPDSKLEPGEMEFAEQVATALATLEAVAQPPAARPIGFAEIYAYATDPLAEPSRALTLGLASEPALQATLRRLLANTALGRLPQVAAASTGAVEAREGNGCRIEFKPSRADPNQLYVLIGLAEGWTRAPATLFVYSPQGNCLKVSLPAAQDGRIQLLVESESDLARALRDVATEVYLS